MIKKLLYITFVIVLTAGISFAQDAKDISQKPQSFDNPSTVSGPALEAPLADFYESFEGATFPPAGWIKHSPDGGTGWELIQAGTTPLPGWTGGEATPAPVTGSGTGMAYATWTTGGATSNDQWLVSPQINNVGANDTLKFWMRKFSNQYLDNVDILISTTGNATADFTITVENIALAVTDTGWVEYSYVLGNHVSAGSNIYVAWREFVADNFNDGAAIFVDEVRIVPGGGGVYSFFDNFDSYVAGQFLALQNPTEWTTWDNNPGGSADALVSDAFSFSNPNSVLIAPNNDLVRLHGDLTSGKWYTGFLMYIPTGKAGYFNMLSDFTFNTGGYWAFECYFDVGGGGRLSTGGGITNFTWTPDTWQWVEVVIDLDLDQAQLWMGGSIAGNLVHQWAWTDGATTGTGPLVIDAHDFFGGTANDAMYIDNFFIGPVSITPVELTSFGAQVNAAGNVVLNWTTGSEVNNQMFEIERRTVDGEYFRIGYVEGNGTTLEPQSYSYTDASVTPGTYFYRLKQIDYIGTSEYSNEVMIEVKAPIGYGLAQNYPNPFNPSTVIDFNIAEPTMVKLAIYNLLGEEVQVLRNEYMQPGFYQVNFDAVNLPSGMYIYKLETASFTQARKMMLMK